MYSKHLAWGYIDHGPIVAFLIKIFSIFSYSGFSLRFGAVLSTCILSISMYFFGKFYFSQKTGMFLSLLISANLLFHINSTIITPDVHVSNRLPSLTAFFIPSGIEIKYANKVVQRPKLIETGSFSITKSKTLIDLK